MRMALVYRAIWTDPNPALIAAGRSAFAAWLKSKEIPVELPETGTAITANAEISVTAVDDGDVSALRARLIEERPAAAGVERWTTTVVWLTSKEEGWIWVDLERVSDDPFARQPDVAAPRLVSELLRSGSERGSTQRLGPDGGPARFAPTRAGILTGRVVAIDPGHNGENFTDTGYIDTTVFNGRQPEACDTTGTETDAGYTEAQFNFNVALDLTAILRSEGASVVLTRTSNTGVGPCITERAAIGNVAHADAARPTVAATPSWNRWPTASTPQ
jgi:N-acetylmuramoyl-L-alanine amidase